MQHVLFVITIRQGDDQPHRLLNAAVELCGQSVHCSQLQRPGKSESQSVKVTDLTSRVSCDIK